MESRPHFTGVTPVTPVAPYLGGKSRLARTIIQHIEKIPHHLYAEPFVGMGGVFLRRSMRPRAEVINDVSRDITTLYRVLQNHYLAFIEYIRFLVSARAEFERQLTVPGESLTDIQRAARFLYLQRTGFGGKPGARSFGVSPDRPSRFDVTKLIPMLDALAERLAPVTIECLDWREFIERYDREQTLFYLDPPYYGSETDYGRDIFARDQFEKMAEQLAGLKGRFILSLNDRPEVREIFGAFEMEAVQARYSVSKETKGRRSFGELIITG